MAERLYWTCGSGKLDLQLTLEDAESGHHQGECEDDVRALRRLPYVAEQLRAWDPEHVRDELRGYGAWEEDDLADEDLNEVRMLWLACGDIVENAREAGQ